MKQSYERPKILMDLESIKEELQINNLDILIEKMDENKKYLLIKKYISFADIPTSKKLHYSASAKEENGAFTKKKIAERVKANSAFYASFDEMIKWEWKNRKDKVFFCQTKQASIYLPSDFYKFLGVNDPTTRLNKINCNWNGSYKLNNDFIKIYACNSTLDKYFTKNLTQKTYDKLDRLSSANEINLSDGDFTELDVTVTPTGIGMLKTDKVFTQIRENLFAKDKIILLLEKNLNEYNIYIGFYRNPKFFILNGIYNKDYLISRFGEQNGNDDVQESRSGQAKWRDELAEYSLSIAAEEKGFIECPFTGVKVQYPAESAFLRASHIKAYSKCKLSNGKINIEEAYDLNNGFLIIADVDALFDKYLISVDPETAKIVKSDILSSDVLNHLKLNTTIDKKYMSEKKKDYLQIHYDEFKRRNFFVA